MGGGYSGEGSEVVRGEVCCDGRAGRREERYDGTKENGREGGKEWITDRTKMEGERKRWKEKSRNEGNKEGSRYG